MAKIGNGGGIPLERWREGDGDQCKDVKYGLFTVFVDNLPSAMDVKVLFKLFSQFGIAKNDFIPFKRRTMSKSRFGFVRFNCPVAADIAIQKGNGLLVEERVLEVKKLPRTDAPDLNRAGENPIPSVDLLILSVIGLKFHIQAIDRSLKFNSEFSTINFGNVLKEKGLDHVRVRKGGGRDIVLTFKSQEELKSNICNIKEWFKEWS
ncbi:hypothetical protein ACSBR1_018574 [Camellia fascicularis]